MTDTTLRPRYKFSTELSSEDIRNGLRTALKDKAVNEFELQYRSVQGHLIVSFPQKHKHFWSPTLDVNLEDGQNGKTTVRVLIGPEPSIWTMFMFFYTLGGLAMLAGLVLGYSQWTLGKGVLALWLIPVGFAIILFFYLAALGGKAKAQDQMKILKTFMEEAIGQPVFHEEEQDLN